MNEVVEYHSGTHIGLGSEWDTMQVIYKNDEDGTMRIRNSHVIARNFNGQILRKVDIVLNHWEVISDESDLRGFQQCFDERDRLALEKANTRE